MAHAHWRRGVQEKAALAAALTLLSLAQTSCLTEACDRDNDEPATEYRAGITSRDRTSYMTGKLSGTFLDFPAGKRYRLLHNLGAEPSSVRSYVSFSPNPLAKGGGGFSESAGNQTVTSAANDRYVEVLNDTCTHFFLRVEAEARGTPDAGASVDLGGEADGEVNAAADSGLSDETALAR